MYKMRPNVALTLSLASILLGSPAALAWSALQYDCDKDASDTNPTMPSASTSLTHKHSVYDEIMDRLDKQAEAQPAGGAQPSGNGQPPAANNGSEAESGKTAEQAAPAERQSETAKETPSEPQQESAANTASTNKDGELVEIAPKTAKRPGRMPHETITDPTFFYRRSLSFMEESDYQSALNYIDRALALNPEFWEAWYQKALIYQLAGYDAPAARRYLALIQRRPEMVPAHIALGMLYRKHGNQDLAEDEYRTAIDLSPRCFAAHYNLANLLMDEKKPEKALREYQNCLKIKPDNAQVHNNIGVIYEARRYYEEAEKEFAKAAHLDPANSKFADNLDRIRKQIGTQKTAGQSPTYRMPL